MFKTLAMRASLGLIYRDHLADPVANHQGVNSRPKLQTTSSPLLWTAEESFLQLGNEQPDAKVLFRHLGHGQHSSDTLLSPTK